MSKDPKLISGFRKSYIALALGIAILTTTITLNQFMLRFFWPTGLFDNFFSPARMSADSQSFSDHWPLYVAYIASIALATITGALSMRLTKSQPWSSSMRKLVLLFLVVSVLAALSGGAIAVIHASSGLGRLDGVFYWCGLTVVWLGFTGMALVAFRCRDRDILFEWLLHNTGLANLAIMIYPLTFLLLPLNLTIDEAFAASVTLSFTGMIALTFWVVVRLRSTRKAPNRDKLASVTNDA
ncbi:MAG: hypothetical protein MPJ78_19385 [Hyphomicrobiaceae bacterium]|nr:hypothetical protein [Hyphomicrobiaceae bacterium]